MLSIMWCYMAKELLTPVDPASQEPSGVSEESFGKTTMPVVLLVEALGLPLAALEPLARRWRFWPVWPLLPAQ